MKPQVGELVFCSGKYCKLIFCCNVAFSVVTLLLNSAVLISLRRIAKRKSWKVPSVILCSMSITDLLTGLFCQPLHGYFVLRSKNVYDEENLGYFESWLFFALNYSSYSLCCTSLLIASFMSVERFMAIAFTLHHHSHSSVPRSVVVIASLAAFSMLVALLRFISKDTQIIFLVLLALVVVVSLSIILVAYIMLFRSFKKQRIKAAHLSTAEKDHARGIRQEKRLANSFALLTTILVAMYLPQLLLKPISIMVDVKAGTKASEIMVILEDSFNTILYCNSAVNPFVYFARHEDVKLEIRSLFCTCSKMRAMANKTASSSTKTNSATIKNTQTTQL